MFSSFISPLRSALTMEAQRLRCELELKMKREEMKRNAQEVNPAILDTVKRRLDFEELDGLPNPQELSVMSFTNSFAKINVDCKDSTVSHCDVNNLMSQLSLQSKSQGIKSYMYTKKNVTILDKKIVPEDELFDEMNTS